MDKEDKATRSPDNGFQENPIWQEMIRQARRDGWIICLHLFYGCLLEKYVGPGPEVVVPDRISSLCSGAFGGRRDLTGITLPKRLKFIDGYAFSGCTGLTSVTIPESVVEICDYAFYGCTGLTEIKVDTENKFYRAVDGLLLEMRIRWKWDEEDGVDDSNGLGELKPGTCEEEDGGGDSSVRGDTISGMYEEDVCALSGMKPTVDEDGKEGDWEGYEKHYVLHCCPLGKTGALVIPEGIRGICESAFSGCVSLTHIEIPGRNTYISPFVFEGCTGLSGVVLPKGIIQICEGAFSGCVSLTRVDIPEGVVEIGRNAFSGCVNLTRVDIPESVVEIDRNAFSGCTGLSEVTIPKGISRIGSNAFSGCTSLRTAIPETGEDDWTEGDDYGEDASCFADEFEEDDSWEYGSEFPEDSPYEDEAGDCHWDRDGTGIIFSNREKQTLKSKPVDNGQKGENMEKQERDLLTLEERLQYAAESRASSPEAAVRMVRKFSEIPAGYFFCGAEDLDAMNELTGRFWEHPSVDVDTYHGFCQTFRLAIIYDTACRMRDQPEMVLSAEDCDHPCQLLWRAGTVNAVILLGLMLLDHAKDRGKNKDIYHCMRMTLGQYLDALAEFTSGEEGMPGSSHTDFRLFGQCFLKSHDGSWTLGEALADILRRYIAAQQEFGRLDHILRCMDALCCCLEEQGGTQADSARQFREILGKYCPGLEGRKLMEEGGRYPDPYGHYLALAGAYPEDVPDPGREGLAPRAVRSQVFLPEYDCSPQSLRALAAQTPFRDFRELLEKNICEERMAHAMEEINASAVYLYTMWVEPYLPAEWSGF